MNTSAAYGFTATLIDLIQKQQPTHLAIAFDTSAPTARHELHPEYKANREAMPEDLSIALPYIETIAEGFNIPIKMDGYEADDIIGTLAHKAEADGFDSIYGNTRQRLWPTGYRKNKDVSSFKKRRWCGSLGIAKYLKSGTLKPLNK